MAKLANAKGGRPANYTVEQVEEVVATLLERGAPLEAITAKAVKPVLCERFQVSQGVREDALEGRVANAVEIPWRPAPGM